MAASSSTLATPMMMVSRLKNLIRSPVVPWARSASCSLLFSLIQSLASSPVMASIRSATLRAA